MRRRVFFLALLIVWWPRSALAEGGAQGLPAAEEAFTERAAELGLDFVHLNGASGKLYLAEILGSGAALWDYDQDGDLDLYLVQGGRLEARPPANEGREQPDQPLGRLFRNLLIESGRLAFRDATAESGLRAAGYGMGVAAGDFDNDGDPDLYLANLGRNQLWRNNGDGSFTEITAAAGADDPRFSTGAAWLDYDDDGFLDLFVCNYVDFSLESHKECRGPSGLIDYCGPLSYQPYPDRLLRNRGDGTFSDDSASSRIASEYGGCLGVAADDFDLDGRLDLYVANDALANQLWINRGDGRFENRALLAGCAFNAEGKAEGSMGIDSGDYDGDGDPDLFMTHIFEEKNTLYRNLGSGSFEDASFDVGLAAPSYGRTGFGTAWIDYDGDGWLDLLIANGAVRFYPRSRSAAQPYPLDERNQLFRNLGGGRFEETSAAGGPAFELSEVSRGAAFGDLDNDLDPDVVITNNGGPVRLLINQAGNRSRWLGLRLLRGKRDAYGASAGVQLEDGRVLWRRVRAEGSYASSNDPRIAFGLAAEHQVVGVTVRWPGGRCEQWKGAELAVGRYNVLQQGRGRSCRSG